MGTGAGSGGPSYFHGGEIDLCRTLSGWFARCRVSPTPISIDPTVALTNTWAIYDVIHNMPASINCFPIGTTVVHLITDTEIAILITYGARTGFQLSL